MKDIKEIKDVEKLQRMATDLWMILDDIDTLDDACKCNDVAFRDEARKSQQERHKILTSDGYNLFVPDD